MRLVVTGGSGKIGRYVLQELLAYASHEIIVFDQVPAASALGVRTVQGDIEDFGQVLSVLDGAEAVIHLAAIPAPGLVPDHVLFRTNLLGTYHVHEAAARVGIDLVVTTGSTGVLGWPYGARDMLPTYLPIDERHPLEPHDPYGLAKLCEEQVARSYTVKSGMTTIVLRLARVLFPESGEELRRQGGLRPKSFNLCTYVDVRDAARAFRQTIDSGCTGHEVAFIVADDNLAAEPLADLLPRTAPQLAPMAGQLSSHQSLISNEHARHLLAWQPQHSWRDAGD